MQLESYCSIGMYNSVYTLFCIPKEIKHYECLVYYVKYIFSTKMVLNGLIGKFDICFSVILHVLIVSLPHLPNTSSTITQSSNSSVAASDNILSTTATRRRSVSVSSLTRSRMLNPCIGRGHSTATNLSDEILIYYYS